MSAILVTLSELKLDPRLQARTRVDQGVVDDYAQLVREGATFPPIAGVAPAGRRSAG